MSDYLEGSAHIPREVQRNPNISWKAKLAYLSLSSRINARGQCFPSHATIAAESSYSVDTAKRALAELADLKLVSWVKATREVLLAAGFPDTVKVTPGREPNLYTLSPAPPRSAVSTTSEGSQHPHVVPTALQTKQGNEAREERRRSAQRGGSRTGGHPTSNPTRSGYTPWEQAS